MIQKNSRTSKTKAATSPDADVLIRKAMLFFAEESQKTLDGLQARWQAYDQIRQALSLGMSISDIVLITGKRVRAIETGVRWVKDMPYAMIKPACVDLQNRNIEVSFTILHTIGRFFHWVNKGRLGNKITYRQIIYELPEAAASDEVADVCKQLRLRGMDEKSAGQLTAVSQIRRMGRAVVMWRRQVDDLIKDAALLKKAIRGAFGPDMRDYAIQISDCLSEFRNVVNKADI